MRRPLLRDEEIMVRVVATISKKVTIRQRPTTIDVLVCKGVRRTMREPVNMLLVLFLAFLVCCEGVTLDSGECNYDQSNNKISKENCAPPGKSYKNFYRSLHAIFLKKWLIKKLVFENTVNLTKLFPISDNREKISIQCQPNHLVRFSLQL